MCVNSFDYKTELKRIELSFDEIIFLTEVMLNIDDTYEIEKLIINQYELFLAQAQACQINCIKFSLNNKKIR